MNQSIASGRLNYRHLYYFHRVAEEGSMTAASRILHVSQPALSAQIRKLEQAVGETLFDRSGRSLRLTDVGRLVNEYAREIFELGQDLVDAVAGRTEGPRAFRVGLSQGFPKLLAHHLIEPAMRRWSDMVMSMVSADPARLFGDLAVHDLDVVLTDAPLPPTVDVRAYNHRLGECGVVLLGGADLAERYREGFPDSLRDAPILMPTENTALRRAMREWFADRALEPTIVAEINDSAVIKVFGAEGAGLFAVPEPIGEEVERMYGVRRVGLLEGLREEFYAISVERRVRNPAVGAIVEAAREHRFLERPG